MNNPLISVIIPVYNVEEYLEECIDSVLKQTYKEIEIIAINDGSTDNSLKILENYASKIDRLKIITQENLGQSVARNVGINKANGTYIYFLDSDDYIMPETFEQLINAMEEHNLDLIRFSAEAFVDNMDKTINNKHYDYKEVFDSNKVYSKRDFLKVNIKTYWPSPVLYIVRKDTLINNNILFKSGIIHEDVLFTLEVFLNSNLGMYNPNYYYKRRYRPNSTMTSQSMEKRKQSFDSRCIILNELSNMLKSYRNRLEVKFIKKRIRSVTTMLIYNYKDIDKTYRKNKIKSLESFSVFQYYYCILRKNIMNPLAWVHKLKK